MDDVERFMNLGDCTREEAIEWLKKGSLTDALALKMGVVPVEKKLSKQQEFFTIVRQKMDSLEQSIVKGLKTSNQVGSSLQDDSKTHHEGTAQQNNCSHECQTLSQESEVQIPGIVCQSPSERFCDLQLSDQT